MKNILLTLTTLGLGFLAHADKNDCFYKGEHKQIEHVVVSDTYADFLEYRDLYVEMRIKGSLLACEFSPIF
ncbi:MAG: hypothetical protein R3A80_13385 [Bdellovibrionota bacterium]